MIKILCFVALMTPSVLVFGQSVNLPRSWTYTDREQITYYVTKRDTSYSGGNRHVNLTSKQVYLSGTTFQVEGLDTFNIKKISMLVRPKGVKAPENDQSWGFKVSCTDGTTVLVLDTYILITYPIKKNQMQQYLVYITRKV